MKEMSTIALNPPSPTRISSPSNRKGRTKTSPQKDRSPRDRRERSKSFGNSLALKSVSPAFYENQTETQNIVLETSILSSSKTDDMNNDDSFLLDEEILLTPENIKSMTSPVKPTSTSPSSLQLLPPQSVNITSSTQNGVDILELLSRKDNIVKLAQAAKHVAEASSNNVSTSQPISVPLTKKRSPSSPVPSPTSTSSMSSMLKTPSPPTRDTSAIPPTLSERFAGPGFCNSPAPANLPIPSFVDIPVHQPANPASPSSANSVQTKHQKSKSFNSSTRTNRGPTRLNFNTSPKDITTQPQSPLPSQKAQIPQSAVPSPFSPVPTFHATTSPVEAPPSQYLNQLSDQLKSMLNICPVHS